MINKNKIKKLHYTIPILNENNSIININNEIKDKIESKTKPESEKLKLKV